MNIDEISKTTTDVMNQISAYSQEDVENYTSMLKQELETQRKLNTVLQENGHQTNINNIHNVIERNKNTVDYQLDELKMLCDELKTIVNENKELKSNYEEVLQSEECDDISKKLKEIKTLRMDMQHFLEKAGI